MTILRSIGLVSLAALGCAYSASAQNSPYQRTAEEKRLDSQDSLILATMIEPQIKEAGNNGQAPDWEGLRSTVALKYDGTAADRAITKQRIYYYYNKDWSLFATAIVHYTEAYESKENLKLMNKNARMVMQYSQNPKEWKIAQAWVKHAMDKDPSEPAYKDTYDALEAKIKG